MRFLFMILLLFSFATSESIKIATSANVSYAMSELKETFLKQNPNSRVDIILGSSGKLTAQILHLAPYDIFLSADMKYPFRLQKKNLTATKPKIYAKGSLIIFTIKDNIDLSKGIAVVKDAKKIAVANYKTAPYGKASVEALKNAKLFKIAKPKFINGESIAQSVQYSLIATDIGFIAKSSIFSNKMKKYNKIGKNWVDVNRSLYRPIEQGVVILKRAKENNLAKKFYEFLFSKEAKAIFKKYGYITD